MKHEYKKLAVTTLSITAILGVILILAFFVIINPQNKKLAELDHKLKSKVKEYDNAFIASTTESKNKLTNKVQGKCDKLFNYAIDISSAAVPSFEINQIANELNLTDFTSKARINTMSREKDAVFRPRSLVLSFTSDFQSFGKFINHLERHKPFIYVDKIRSKASHNETNEAKWTVEVFFYVLNDKDTFARSADTKETVISHPVNEEYDTTDVR